MLRCYDCARLIPEGEAQRCTVKVGYSAGASYRHPARIGDPGSTVTHSTSHYAQVTLCRNCLASRRLRFFVGCFSTVVLLAVLGTCAYVFQDEIREWFQEQQKAAAQKGPVARPVVEDGDAKKSPPPAKDEPRERAEPLVEDGAAKKAMPPATVKNESGYRLGWNTTKGSNLVWNLNDLGTATIWPGTKSTVYFHLPGGAVSRAELVSGGRYVITKEGKGLKVTQLP
jgi:hypothetical protein